MRAEIIGIGTEILLGQITNSNAKEISERLADIGVDVLHHQVVGDNVARIAEAFGLALSRADIVIATGGLGPTGDDVTREGVAAVTGRALVRHPEIEEFLREKFRRLGREMPGSNLVQADVPEGARYILPDRGTAPGLVLEHDGRRIYVVPGVPAEMREMLEGTIVPELSSLGGPVTIRSRVLKVVGVAEARVAETLEDLFERLTNPTVAYLAGSGEVRVRLTAKAATADEADALIAPVEAEIRQRIGPALFGADDDSLESVVGDLLRTRGLTVAVAESLTGGSLAARLIDVPGASEYVAGAIVAYSENAKRELLGVPQEVISGVGMVSAECARAMALGVRRLFGADVGVATTGVAGPDELEGKPAGTVFVGVSGPGEDAERGVRAPGDREQVRRWSEQAALELVRRALLDAL